MTDDATALILPVAVVVASACAIVAILVGRRTNPGRDDRWFVAAIVSFMAAAMPFEPFGFDYEAAQLAWAWRLPIALVVALPAFLLHVVAGLAGGNRGRIVRPFDALTLALLAWLLAMPSLPGPGYEDPPWWYTAAFTTFLVQAIGAVAVSVRMLLRASRGSTGAARMRGRLLAWTLAAFGIGYLGWFSSPNPTMEFVMSAASLVAAILLWGAMRSPQHAYELFGRDRADAYGAVEGLVATRDVRSELHHVLRSITNDWGLAGIAAIDGDGDVIDVVGAARIDAADHRGTPSMRIGGTQSTVTLAVWPTPLTPPLRAADRERLTVLAHLIELALRREATDRRRHDAEAAARTADQRMADASESLRAAREVRERAVRSVAHELRSPVNALLGLSDALETRWETLPSGQLEPLQGLVARQVARLAVVVDKLLVVSSIDDGALRSAPERVDVRGLVRSIASEGIDADVGYRCDDDASDCDVHAEPIALREIVTQLLDNAARHGSSPVEVRVAPAGDQVQVEVLDHGPGIDPSLEPVLFERFTRGAGDGERGLGLGLAIVRELTDSIGGSSGYRRSGTQTSFWIRLPRAAPAAT